MLDEVVAWKLQCGGRTWAAVRRALVWGPRPLRNYPRVWRLSLTKRHVKEDCEDFGVECELHGEELRNHVEGWMGGRR